MSTPNVPPTRSTWPQPGPPTGPVRRRGWLAPVVAAVVCALVGGGATFTALTLTSGVLRPAATPTPAVSAAEDEDPDVCAMLDAKHAARLVPDAEIASRRDDQSDGTIVSYVTWTCEWRNTDISYKEFRRTREISLRVSRYNGLYTKTGAGAAKTSMEAELSGYEYGAKTSKKDNYYSQPQKYPEIGDGAIVRYQWSREAGSSPYSMGEGQARVGEVVFDIKFKATQQNKEEKIFKYNTVKLLNEENALREVKGLLGEAATAVKAWKAGKPLQRQQVAATRPTPTPTPSPTISRIALPAHCKAAGAAKLVPGTEGAAGTIKEDGAEAVKCEWWNEKIPSTPGKVFFRGLKADVYTFPSADKAHYYFIDKRAAARNQENGGVGKVYWYRVDILPGLGDEAFGQVIKSETDTAHSNRYIVYVRKGDKVFWTLYSGNERPEGEAVNSGKSILMAPKVAKQGALNVMKAILGAYSGTP